MRIITQTTNGCVTFVQREAETDYVRFVRGVGLVRVVNEIKLLKPKLLHRQHALRGTHTHIEPNIFTSALFQWSCLLISFAKGLDRGRFSVSGRATLSVPHSPSDNIYQSRIFQRRGLFLYPTGLFLPRDFAFILIQPLTPHPYRLPSLFL